MLSISQMKRDGTGSEKSCILLANTVRDKMAPSDYATAGSGKLKLKGVKDSKVDKKKKKKSKPGPEDEEPSAGDAKHGDSSFQDRSVMLKKLEDEDTKLAKEERREIGTVDGEAVGASAGIEQGEDKEVVKTEAERRYEEQRRRRVCSALLLPLESEFPPGCLSVDSGRGSSILTFTCSWKNDSGAKASRHTRSAWRN